jgi:hypothetical protein
MSAILRHFARLPAGLGAADLMIDARADRRADHRPEVGRSAW